MSNTKLPEIAVELIAAKKRIIDLEAKLRYVGLCLVHEFNTQEIIDFIGMALAPVVEPVAPACKHKSRNMGYMEWHRWAEDQTKKGIMQTQCPICKLYLFPSEF